MALPWYMYPLDNPAGSYGKIGEPLNPTYLKPDVNIQIPAGVPITAWDGGLVTDVSNKGGSAGGLSVTIRLAHPPNGVATYASFNYLGSASVKVNQLVQPGQQVGVAGSPTGINFALALGNTPSWGSGSFPQGSGDPRYDPHIILNQLRSGQTPTNGTFNLNLFAPGSQVFGPVFLSVSNKTTDILNNVPGFVGIVDAIDNAEQFQPFQLKSTGGQDVGILGHLPFVGSAITGAANTITLPSDAIQALLVFVTANTMAALIRLVVIMAGVILLVALIMNIIGTTFEDVTGVGAAQAGSAAIRIGALAAA